MFVLPCSKSSKRKTGLASFKGREERKDEREGQGSGRRE